MRCPCHVFQLLVDEGLGLETSDSQTEKETEKEAEKEAKTDRQTDTLKWNFFNYRKLVSKRTVYKLYSNTII